MRSFPLQRLWFRISETSSLPRRAVLATEIARPLLRLIVRVLGNTIYARKENSKPTQRELACLFHVLYRWEAMNFGWEFLLHLMQYKDLPGELWLGGMITRVVTYFEVDLQRYTPILAMLIDRPYLEKTKSIAKNAAGALVSIFEGHETVLLKARMDMQRWIIGLRCGLEGL